MGWHTNRVEHLEDELVQKDQEIEELKREIAWLKSQVNRFHPAYSPELEDYKALHKEEE